MAKTKNLIERLYEYHPKVTRSAEHMIILALYDEISAATKVGWSIKKIWQLLQHEQKIKVSYQSFYTQYKKIHDAKQPVIISDKTVKAKVNYNPIPNKADLI